MTRLPVTLALSGLVAATLPAGAAGPIQGVSKLWSFDHAAATPGRSAEIPVWDAATQALWVVGGNGLDVLDVGGNLLRSFTTSAFGSVNSLAISNGVLAMSFSNGIATSAPGSVQFFDTGKLLAQGGLAAHLGGVAVGAVPDMVTWTAGGKRLLVANEGERQSDADNPAGSVSIIDFNSAAPLSTSVTTAGFAAWNGQEAALRAAGVRIQSGVSASAAFEPEYIAVSGGGRYAQVTLQESNAIAELDLQTGAFTRILPLGTKDFSAAGNRIDPSDSDSAIGSLRNVPVKGLYMPDAIVSYRAGGKTFYVMTNEGDAFVDDADIVRFGNAAVSLDPTVFNGTDLPDEATLKAAGVLGRLNILRAGATGDGSSTGMQEIVTLGGRSFSIRDENGQLVFDSGESLEAAAIAAGLYADNRSDDKGVEPEGIAVFELGGRTLAFIGMERSSLAAIAVYDITDPANTSFLQLIQGDLPSEIRPEGLVAFEAGGLFYLAVANEDAGGGLGNRTMLFQITAVPEPSTYALMLGGLGLVGALARRRKGSNKG